MVKVICYILLLILANLRSSLGIWCYRCTSATPGCGEHFNWRGIGYLGDPCPYDTDICVKVIERRGAEVTYTRDCLSALNFRTDIPSDHYEGCRPAVEDVRLANYVNHDIKEHDVKRNYYTNVEFCFCFLDHRCNDATTPKFKIVPIIALVFSILYRNFVFY